MSCGRPIDEEEAIPTGPALAAACAKCKQPAVVQSQRTSYCQSCFMAAFTFKTRKGVDPARQASRGGSQTWHKRNPGKSRGLERDSVMIAFSGGPSSRALMDVIKFFFPPADHATQTNAKFKPPPYFAGCEVVYVDQSELDGFGPDRTDEVRAIVATTGFAFHSIKLSDLFASSPDTPSLALQPSTSNLLTHPSTSTSISTPLSQLRALLAPLPPTSRASLHASLVHALLLRTALARNHSTLLTGESSTRLAIRTIAGMALGRGFSMGEEVGWEYESDEGVLVCRPLRGVVDDEIVYYNQTKGLEWLEMSRPSDGVEPKKAGIEAVSEEFVNNLEATFASTVSTVLRTAHKLGLRTNHRRNELTPTGATCPLCGLPAQPGAENWRAAVTISSLGEAGGASSEAEAVADGEGGVRALGPLLCYGCLLNWQGAQQAAKRLPAADGVAVVEETVPLPPYVAEAAQRRWAARAEDKGEVVGERTIGVDDLRAEVDKFLL